MSTGGKTHQVSDPFALILRGTCASVSPRRGLKQLVHHSQVCSFIDLLGHKYAQQACSDLEILLSGCAVRSLQ